MEHTRTFSIAILIGIAAACLLPSTIGEYTISPQTKGWAISDITDESYTIHVVNTDSHSTVQVQAIPQAFQYIENVSVFRPVPGEFWQYITITPDLLNLGANEEGDFTVHVSFPDLPEMYAHTWEYRILLNDTNKYNYEDGGPDLTQKLAIVRLYLPLTKPIIPYEPPFYVYPFIIVFSLIFLGGIIMYLKRRSVPLALRDHESHGSEWAGMEVMNVPTSKPKNDQPVIIAEAMIPPELKSFVEDPTANHLPQRQPMIRQPVRSPVIAPTVVDKERERKDRENARKRELRALKKQSDLRKPATYKKVA